MSKIDSKNIDNFSSKPNVVGVSNPVKEMLKDVRVEKVLESDEEFVYGPEINAVIQRKKTNEKQRGKTAKIKAAEINHESSGVSAKKVIIDSASMAPTVPSEINRIRKHVFGPAKPLKSDITQQRIIFYRGRSRDKLLGDD